MYYELYIDVLFLVNFMMDYILLLITRRLIKADASYGRVCLGALAGSILTCDCSNTCPVYVYKIHFVPYSCKCCVN